ncbi:T-complex protein 1 subunit theta-like [Dysidea avara]|uniref:T-complex protein 1 subunit theta-like n=1 Tax=Dysidea avara TaxID=196820 RepID=UPI003326B4F5
MAMHVPSAGFASMLKEGAKHYHGLEEAVFRNITACRDLAQITRTSYGPNGMDKMVVNHLEKLFVTNDAATILKELEVQHPAAKMIVMATEMQEQEVGDGTNFVLVFSGALLEQAEGLLRMGLSPSDVIEGYEMAAKKVLEILPSLVCYTLKDLQDVKEVSRAIHTAIASKQYGNADFLSDLVAEACVSILPKSHNNFSVDNVRVSKILGSGVLSSEAMHGMVFKREVEGDVTKVKDAKIVVYTCEFDAMGTETKGTVLIKSASELMNFSKGEEDQIEQQVKQLSELGINVVVTGGKVGEMSLHFLNKYNIMAVRLLSKFDVRRLCNTVQATSLPKMVPPSQDEIGHCDIVEIGEIGDTNIIVFKQEKEESAVSTIIVRGSTDNIMDDIERAVDDGINTFRTIVKDKRFVPGAGATEIELARQLSSYAQTCPGLEQYAIKAFGEGLESLVRALAENAGYKGTEVISKLYAAHQEDGSQNIGFDNEGEGASVKDAAAAWIIDCYLLKVWAIKLATNAVNTVLRVDQIIMAKPAGGPKPRDNPNWDEDR